MPAAIAPIGHELTGMGASPVVIMNDWLCDTSTWDGARIYLDRERFTWVFADLRGYGKSRQRSGAFTLAEAVSDILGLADAHGWARFAIVGHSMSSLVALQLAQQAPERISHAVVITPPPPTGFGADEAAVQASRALALADDETRMAVWKQRGRERLPSGWDALKVSRWRACCEPEAAAAYVSMFARDGLANPTQRIAAPLLAITGEQDIKQMRSAAVSHALAPLCERLTLVSFADCGHYPMQEMPPLLVATLERFLAT